MHKISYNGRTGQAVSNFRKGGFRATLRSSVKLLTAYDSGSRNHTSTGTRGTFPHVNNAVVSTSHLPGCTCASCQACENCMPVVSVDIWRGGIYSLVHEGAPCTLMLCKWLIPSEVDEGQSVIHKFLGEETYVSVE